LKKSQSKRWEALLTFAEGSQEAQLDLYGNSKRRVTLIGGGWRKKTIKERRYARTIQRGGFRKYFLLGVQKDKWG